MIPLRKMMISAMRQSGFFPRTNKSYLAAVIGRARDIRRSPNLITSGELQDLFDSLVHERNLAAASYGVEPNGERFLYRKVLE